MSTKKSIVMLIFLVLNLTLAACQSGSYPPEPGQLPVQQTQPANRQPADAVTSASEQTQKLNEQPAGNPPAQSGAAERPPADAPSEQGRPENAPDLAAAAKTLGITEQELMDALGPPPPDLAAAARTLGITEQELQNALFAAGAPGQAQAGEPQAAQQSDNSGLKATTAASTAPAAQPSALSSQAKAGSYPIVDTGQSICYDDRNAISCPQAGAAYYGQDAQYAGNQPSYTLSADGLTVYDNVTGLTWTQSPDLDGDGDIDVDDKLTFAEAQAYPDALNAANFGGYNDWRLPTIKELYSLMDFRGTDPSGPDTSGLTPFIDTDYFAFGYGDTDASERFIDAQFWSSNTYLGTVFGNQTATFGLNLADGRIKGYPSGTDGPITKLNYVYFVRGNAGYGVNDFGDNGDPSTDSGQAGTITDNATGLTWSQDDSGTGMNWEQALAWVAQKNDENYLGHDDWRLPNAKEMQSIVDYSRSPDATNSAAINPVFNITPITNEAGEVDYPWFWTGTTHVKSNGSGFAAVYICFGRALGYMHGTWIDVHGAGAQRSDPKSGDPADYPTGHGPQGDAIRIYNYVRLVRGGTTGDIFIGGVVEPSAGSPATPPGSNAGLGQSAGTPGREPDLAAAAARLGVSEEALRDTLGDPRQGPPDFAVAAQQLGIAEEELIAALGVPPAGQPPVLANFTQLC